MNVTFEPQSLNDLQWLNTEGQKSSAKKAWALIHDIQRNGYQCTGQPEQLSGDDAGWYSVRIDKKNRMIFKIDGDTIVIRACRTHYGDK
jgi:toxin YoeB